MKGGDTILVEFQKAVKQNFFVLASAVRVAAQANNFSIQGLLEQHGDAEFMAKIDNRVEALLDSTEQTANIFSGDLKSRYRAGKRG